MDDQTKLRMLDEILEVIQRYESGCPQKHKRKSIPKTVRDMVWDTYIGNKYGVGKCYCCRSVIDSKKFECGHVVAASLGGPNTVENLRPICGTCNKSMGTQNLEDFRRSHFSFTKHYSSWCVIS